MLAGDTQHQLCIGPVTYVIRTVWYIYDNRSVSFQEQKEKHHVIWIDMLYNDVGKFNLSEVSAQLLICGAGKGQTLAITWCNMIRSHD